MATRLTLISHAATQAQRRAAFPADELLGETEIAKITNLGWSAPSTQRILCGPERRVQETADALGLRAEVDQDLRDCDYGAWSGYELSQIQLDRPDDVATWLTDPGAAPHGGESLLELMARTGRWLEQQRDAGHTLAITHPAVIRGVLVHVLQAPPLAFWRIDVAPLSITDLRFNGRMWTVRSAGCSLPDRTR